MTTVTPLEKAAERKLRALKGRAPVRQVLAYDGDGLPIIRHDNGKLPEICDAVLAAIAARPDLNVMRFAGGLACVYAAAEATEGAIKRPAGAVLVHPMTPPLLAEIATRAARHEKFDARSGEDRPCDCPRRVADTIFARGFYPLQPDLRGFIENPTVDLDGRIIDVPGYDAESGLFCAFGQITGYIRPPQKPTREQARAALARLMAMFEAFPFVAEEDRVALVAAILTALLRRVLPSAPLFGITAPTPGTGKTLLCETLALLQTARRAAVMSMGHDDAETEKRLAGMLLAGDPLIAIDNIERGLRGDLLCQVATQSTVRLRPLGGSGMRDLPTNALLVATGNNLMVYGDLKRRTVLIRLDARTERPERRRFDRDHLADVLVRRGQMISDGLTIVLAYLADGAPALDLYSYGGFEHWDRMVRRPLVWLDLPDPLLTAEGLREADPDLESSRLLLASWFGIVLPEGRAVTASEILLAGSDSNPDLRDALQIICSEKPNARRLGNWLRGHRDRIVTTTIDGAARQLQLEQRGHDRKGFALWRVIATPAESADSAESLPS
jgi:putative DNA primase/helicase